MKSITDFNIRGKTLLVRVDINSPVKKGKILDNARIRAHASTIKKLSAMGARIVVLAHQGRKGSEDFLSLKQHAHLLQKHAHRRVVFINDIYGKKACAAIDRMKNKDIILLENVRFLSEETENKTPEEHARSFYIRTLADCTDIFVQDGFSVCHRSHASVVGFPYTMPNAPGPVLEKELHYAEKLKKPSRPLLLVLGGAKIDDVLKLAEKPKFADKILTGGILAELLLIEKGMHLGKTEHDLKKYQELLPMLKSMERKNVLLPVDLAFSLHGKRKEVSVEEIPTNNTIYDIGSETIELYKKELIKAKTIIMSGPMGVVEKKQFQKGTKEIMKAISAAKCISVISGGSTVEISEEFRIRFSHTSLAGGAFIDYLCGIRLPGIEVLE